MLIILSKNDLAIIWQLLGEFGNYLEISVRHTQREIK